MNTPRAYNSSTLNLRVRNVGFKKTVGSKPVKISYNQFVLVVGR